MPKTLTKKRMIINIIISLIVLLIVTSLCATTGTQKISLRNALSGPGAEPGDNIDYEIFIIRLTRVLLAVIVGAALACSGVVLQAILKNPLADPYILGISSGAGLGAVIAMLVPGITLGFLGGLPIATFAFTGAIITVSLVWFIGYFSGRSQVTSLLLAGVVINAFFSAIIMLLTLIIKTEQLRSTMYWLMGNIPEKQNTLLLFSCGSFVIIGIIVLWRISNSLNIITLGEYESKGLGIDTEKTKLIAFSFAAFITAVAVSISGLIGFVGLIVPHAIRLIFGPDHRQLIPLSAIYGGIFLAIADTIARTAFGQEQLPVGVITAVTGGPFFLILLARYTRKVSWMK
ncbi:MAG: iron ABC transporter permease [Sedimentisphaerales bacterium]|nr:iron ABC transporter permease [Sedimentisphaerales bacterium]